MFGRLFLALLMTVSAASEASSISTGTGFFVTHDGYLITAEHVISGANKVSIKTSTGDVLDARVVRTDHANDIALLRVEGGPFRPIPLGNSSPIRKGEEVFTIGYPLLWVQGQEQKVTNGIISSLSGVRDDPRFFQISVPVQSGNSGGPLLTLSGTAVGLISSKLNAIAVEKTTGDLVQNANYAVKSNYIHELLNSITIESIRLPPQSPQKISLREAVSSAEKAVVLIIASIDEQTADSDRVERSGVEVRPEDGPRKFSAPRRGNEIAWVNGRPIIKVVFDAMLKEQLKRGAQDTAQLQEKIKEELIRREVLAVEANKKLLGELPDFTRIRTDIDAQSYLAQGAVLIRAYMQDFVRANQPSRADLLNEYYAVRGRMGDTEYKVRHVVVETEDEAKAIIAKLKAGEKFDALAKQSKDSGSKDNGGDLGWSNPGMFVKPFSDAMVKLEKGKYSDTPVKSDFGYHVIQLDDVRDLKAPDFEEVKPQLEQRLQQQKIEKHIMDLRAKAKVQ